jgi:DNA modification methylase
MSCKVYVGDCLEQLKKLPDDSVHACITSPPYYGLRSYGTEPRIWPDGEHLICPEGEHEWGEDQPSFHSGQVEQTKWKNISGPGVAGNLSRGNYCQKCGAWRGHLGLEPEVSLYVFHLVQIFREVRRVLRNDGTFWLNLGDSYATQNAVGNRTLTGRKPGQALNCFREGYIPPYHAADNVTTGIRRSISSGLKPKDLMGIPWRVAFALQQDGWWLRSDIIWHKPNCMPSRVEDRPTQAHEYVFLLTKNERYFYDHIAVKEPVAKSGRSSGNKARKIADGIERSRLDTHMGSSVPWTDNGTGRNKRTVWTINTKPWRGAHFAVFPTTLVEPCVLAGTSEQGCCSRCGSPLERVIEKSGGSPKRTSEQLRQEAEERGIVLDENNPGVASKGRASAGLYLPHEPAEIKTTGWKPTCACKGSVKEPCVVLDPFAGSGTVGEVAKSLGRDSILIELNPSYVELIKQRVGDDIKIIG